MTKASMTHNTFYGFTRMADRIEEAQQSMLKYLPETVREHAEELIKAQAEFTRAGYATAARVASVIRSAAEDTEAHLRAQIEEKIEAVKKTVKLA